MSHTAELIAIGTELLLGNIANTDAQMISEGLSELGINVYYHTVVGDNPDRVRQAVEIARRRADIIITTGGLGPTCDDLTKVALAEAFGKKLVYHEPSAQRIRERFAAMERPVTENNFQQAMVPEGCTVLDNDWGTAPGVAFESDGTHVILLPGPPRECEMMFRHRAVPYLKTLSDGVIASRTVKTFGIGESAAEALLRDLMNSLHNPTLAPYAKPTGTELRITAHAATEEEAYALIAPVEEQVKEIIGDHVIGVNVNSIQEVCLNLLKEKGLTLGTAESCTGGLIAKLITDLPGASAVLKGGIVSYTNQVKTGVLEVPQALLEEYGAVSPQVAEAMARGAKKVLGCDIALSATGVAGPDPDDRGNPVGLVYLGLAYGEDCIVQEYHAGRGDRDRVRRLSAGTALDMVRRYLTGLL
ncbi:competence/damage-inducible protein A [Evtepia sp.]|uniref:competence/damage-inducible protein A n=1 Tax=Evtepia sp. TaxID=2773933 RepID=UPI003F13FE0E